MNIIDFLLGSREQHRRNRQNEVDEEAEELIAAWQRIVDGPILRRQNAVVFKTVNGVRLYVGGAMFGIDGTFTSAEAAALMDHANRHWDGVVCLEKSEKNNRETRIQIRAHAIAYGLSFLDKADEFPGNDHKLPLTDAETNRAIAMAERIRAASPAARASVELNKRRTAAQIAKFQAMTPEQARRHVLDRLTVPTP